VLTACSSLFTLPRWLPLIFNEVQRSRSNRYISTVINQTFETALISQQ
jgi:hypothetical protein